MDCYRRALVLTREVSSSSTEAGVLIGIGNLENVLGEKQKALEDLNHALTIWRTVHVRKGEATTLNSIGIAYDDLGDPKDALDYYLQALTIQHEIGNSGGEATALSNNMGLVYSDLKDYQKALESLTEALRIRQSESGGGGGDTGSTLNNIGDVYDDLGDRQKALEYHLRALPLAIAAADPLREALVFRSLMLNLKANQPAMAIFYGKQAVNMAQQVRGNIQGMDRKLQSSFPSSKLAHYHDLANLLIDQGRLPEAEEVIDLMKQQQLNEFTRDETKEATRPASLSAEEQKLEDAYEGATKDLIANYAAWSALDAKKDLTDSEKAQLKDLEAQVQQRSRKFEDLLDHLDTVLQAAEKQKLDRARDDIPGLADLVSKLDKQTVVLYTLVTEDRYRVIVIREDHALVERSTAIKSSDLSRLVVQFVDLLSHPGDTKQLTEVSAKLFSVLVAHTVRKRYAFHQNKCLRSQVLVKPGAWLRNPRYHDHMYR